jgi:molybdopterin synthase catalytic subunit
LSSESGLHGGWKVEKMSVFEIVTEPIVPQTYADYVLRPEAGAVTLFTGHVREWTEGVRTLYLAYEAYVPMAQKKLAEIGREIEEKWIGTKVAIAHRIGELQIGDIAVVIAVSSPHRSDAYEANEYAIERIKEIVPIWKQEIWEDGTQWVGNQRKKPKEINYD